MASKAQRKATKMHRRRAAARGFVRLEVQAARRDADLIRALVETLRDEFEKAKVLRSTLVKALVHSEIKTALPCLVRTGSAKAYDSANHHAHDESSV